MGTLPLPLGHVYLKFMFRKKGYLSQFDLFSFLFIIRPLERNLSLITHLREFSMRMWAHVLEYMHMHE